ncbi:MAG: histone H1 [Bacteroidota bacterium]|nr:histone H1 [Bacteroidota bacterium]MDP4234048.1 histone H1 [Bacteroidota bacterium]MDP4242914.1 histone H1 [Bacteroidota bacterium]MDP4289263.1 histone H1 [Bacteroidota bacterium]
MIKPKKTPRDVNQLAAQIVALSTGQAEPEEELTPEQKFRKEFARSGGLVGGKARAASLSPRKRKEIAKKAAAARWKKKPNK